MDDASEENIRQLKDAGNNYIQQHLEELDRVVETLIENK